MNKKVLSIVFNSLIVVLEIVGVLVTFSMNKRIGFEFYTEDSNILMLITSLLFLIFTLKNKKIPSQLKMLKYISTICLTVTFLVVVFLLAPMYNFSYRYLLFHGGLLYQHFLCPLLSIITFIFFDNLESYSRKDNFKGLSFTIVYAVVLIILNLLGIVDGPYPFLRVNSQSALMSVIWFIVIMGAAYLIALAIRKIHIVVLNGGKV